MRQNLTDADGLSRKQRIRQIFLEKLEESTQNQLSQIQKFLSDYELKKQNNQNSKIQNINKEQSKQQQNKQETINNELQKKTDILRSKQKKLNDYLRKIQKIKQVNQHEIRCSLNNQQLNLFQNQLKNIGKSKVQTRKSKKRVSSIFKNIQYKTGNTIKPHIFIHDQFYYLENYTLKNVNMSFIEPTKQNQQINYDLDSQQEYNQMKGQQLKSDDQKSNQDQSGQQEDQFFVSDGHLSADQISSDEQQYKISIKPINSNQWMFNLESQSDLKNNYKMNYFEYPKLNCLPMKINPDLQNKVLIQKIGDKIVDVNKVCHNNSRAKILSSLKKDFGIQKMDTNNYLKNFCRKKKVNGKIVYIVVDYQGEGNQNTNTKLNCSDVEQNSKKKVAQEQEQITIKQIHKGQKIMIRQITHGQDQ